MTLTHRRNFLEISLAAGTATLAMPTIGELAFGQATNASSKRPIGLGFSLYGMKGLPTEQALNACDEIGYDCIELPVMKDWPWDSAKLSADARIVIRRGLDDRGLWLTALMENLPAAVGDEPHRQHLERLKLAGELAHDLAPDRPAVIETVLGGRPDQWEMLKPAMAERLADWAKIAEQTKAVVSIKAHVGGTAHRPEHVVWLIEQVGSPWLKAAYDFSHFQLRGIDLAESIRTLIPHSVFVHVKDGRGDADQFQFLLPGEGTIDYAALLRLVSAAGYAGDIVVEVSGQIHSRPGYDPLAAAKKSYPPLAAAFQAAGIERG